MLLVEWGADALEALGADPALVVELEATGNSARVARLTGRAASALA